MSQITVPYNRSSQEITKYHLKELHRWQINSSTRGKEDLGHMDDFGCLLSEEPQNNNNGEFIVMFEKEKKRVDWVEDQKQKDGCGRGLVHKDNTKTLWKDLVYWWYKELYIVQS